MGRTAHQGPLALDRRPGCALRERRRQEPHSRVPLPAARAGPDVGGDGGADLRARRRGANGHSGREHPARWRPRRLDLRGRGRTRLRARHLLSPVAHARGHRATRADRSGARRRGGARLPRLPDGRARPPRCRPLSRQLGVRPRPCGQGRADPELPFLEPVDGPRPGEDLHRPRVLLLRGRRAVELERRPPRRAGGVRARAPRPRQPPSARAGLRRARSEGVSGLRRRLRRAPGRGALVARPHREPAAGRPQRAPPVQQLGPLDADRDTRGREPRRGSRPRPVVRQRRQRLPRGARTRRAPVPSGARDPGDQRVPAVVNSLRGVLRVLAWPLGLTALAASIGAFALTADLEALGATWKAAASAPAELLAVLVAFGLAFLVRALTWSRVVPGLHPAHALAAVHLSLAGNHLLPLRLGEALRVTSAVRRSGIPVRTATASTVMLRGADLVAALGLAALLGPQVIGAVAGPAIWLALAVGAGVWLGGLFWLRRRATSARAGGLRPSVALVAVGATAAWVLESVLVWRAAQWAGLELGFRDAVVVTAVTIAAQALAVAPGGVGTYEAGAGGADTALGGAARPGLPAAPT